MRTLARVILILMREVLILVLLIALVALITLTTIRPRPR
jgi:hypothetical protein